ncbi:MAG: hypothetical protein ACREYF_01160, partial [Gammaproteobacteria bacterium]
PSDINSRPMDRDAALALLQDFPRAAATVTDQGSSASSATPRQVTILLIFACFLYRPLLAHNMTS